MSDITIRDEVTRDHRAVIDIHRQAFAGDGPGRLVTALRRSGDAVISLVAERRTILLGHVLFSRIAAPLRALILSPLGVLPDVQKSGIGSALAWAGLDRARSAGWQAVFVLGAPAYYGRFGFSVAAAQSYASPYAGRHFMALRLDAAAPGEGPLGFPDAFAQDIRAYAARRDRR